MDPIRASIAIRARIEEVLARWEEQAAPLGAHRVDFESLDSDTSRISLEASGAIPDEGAQRRALERRLLAFKRRLEGRSGTGVPLP